MKRVLVLAFFAACSPDAPPPPAPPATMPPPPVSRAPSPRNVLPSDPSPHGGASRTDQPLALVFVAPAEWTKQAPTGSMRKAQYLVPDKGKSAGDAQLVVFYLGPNAGTIDANIERWAGQMGATKPKPETLEGKCKVTLLDLQGTYSGDAGGEMPGARMLVAAVEAPNGPWFFKLVGPAATVEGWREEYITMLKEAHP